jgi:hypothetical protein
MDGLKEMASGQSLPMLAYTSTSLWQPQRIRALAIYCSDGRWGAAFDEFCYRHLNLPRYDRLAVPGGPAWVSGIDESRPELHTAAKGQIEFLVRAHELERIIIVTHFGCAFYLERLGRTAETIVDEQITDARRAVEVLRGWFPRLQVDCYLAMRRELCMSFHEL